MTEPRIQPRRVSARSLLVGSLLLLCVSLLAPLWWTRMEAPQYRGEEALKVHVYAGRVSGDIAEIETLNQYVGVHLPLDTPELKASLWIIGGLLLLTIACIGLPSRRRMGAVTLLTVLLATTGVAGAAVLQYRLYQMGHVRSDPIMEGVPDFTPPILGSAKIANFTAHMRLGGGGWAYLAAVLLAGWALLIVRRERRQAAMIDGERKVASSAGRRLQSRLTRAL